MAQTTYDWQNGRASDLAMGGTLFGALVGPFSFAELGPVRRAKDGEVILFRGVPKSEWPQFADALDGIATPIGGHESPYLHNKGNTASIFTSWTTRPNWAKGVARYEGVVLQKTFPESVLVKSPNLYSSEREILIEGVVTGCKVIKMGPCPY